MAADLAKLSLWLATLAKDHPFTFLDHSLRSGDSLVGLGRKQISSLHWEPQKQRTTVTKALEDAIRRAAAARRDILEGGDFLSPELKAQKLALADDALSKPRLIGDAIIAAFFSAEKPKDRQKTLDVLTEPVEEFLSAGGAAGRAGAGDYVAAQSRIADLVNWLRGKPRDGAVAASYDAIVPQGSHSLRLLPFHWELEFPEVFSRDREGFDAIVGNPPFLGGPQLSELLGGPAYQEWLKETTPRAFGNADLAAYFFRRGFSLLQPQGTLGFLSTKTISEGATRTTGLQALIELGATIYDVQRSMKWPGEASVIVSVVHVAGPALHMQRSAVRDGKAVEAITSRLLPGHEPPDPVPVAANDLRSFMGIGLGGSGFVLGTNEYNKLAETLENRECLMPLLGGEEVNTSPTQSHERYAINFGTRSLEEAERFPALLEIVRERVKPERDRQKDHGPGKHGKKYWWQHVLRRDPLYEAIRPLSRCLVTAITTSHLAFSFQHPRQVFVHSIAACAFSTYAPFAALQSRAHTLWADVMSSSLGGTMRYSVGDAFQTFSFPEKFETAPSLEAAGREYYDFRAALMVHNDEGLTKTYNRFHDPSESSPEIAKLRDLHAAMDRAVLDAYHWNDVATTCGFALDWVDLDDDELADTLASAPDDIRDRIESADYFFPDAASACRFQAHIKKAGRGKLPWRYRWPDEVRDDILARLLALNAERAELERLTGLPGAKSKPATGDDAFEDPETEANIAQSSSLPIKKAKKASKRASKKSAPRPMFGED